jgi:hypothetical protein
VTPVPFEHEIGSADRLAAQEMMALVRMEEEGRGCGGGIMRMQEEEEEEEEEERGGRVRGAAAHPQGGDSRLVVLDA